jgi:hypothetical protein
MVSKREAIMKQLLMDGALDIAFYSLLSKVHKLDREQTQTNKSIAICCDGETLLSKAG